MKTTIYNPSALEQTFADALESLQDYLDAELGDNRIEKIENNRDLDNPMLRFHLRDTDGDAHEIVIKIIQTPDK